MLYSLLAGVGCITICWPTTIVLAEQTTRIAGIRHIQVSERVPPAHVKCTKPVESYLTDLFAAANNDNPLPLHRQAFYRDYIEIRSLNWAVPAHDQAEDMAQKAEKLIIEDRLKFWTRAAKTFANLKRGQKCQPAISLRVT